MKTQFQVLTSKTKRAAPSLSMAGGRHPVIARSFHDYSVNLYNTHKINFVEGKGSYLTDVNGKEYFDAHSMYGVTLFGHSQGELYSEVLDQIKSGKRPMTHGAFPKDDTGRAAQRIAEKTASCLGGKAEDFKVMFNNTGAEAVEAGLKFSRLWGTKVKGIADDSRKLVYAAEGCFHGRAMGGTSMFDGKKKAYQEGFGPLLPGIRHLKWNDVDGLSELEKNGRNVAAVIIEPIQGEGGINVPTPEFISKLAEISKRQNILTVVDEVQAGVHRTGPFWASAHYKELGLQPDIILSAKALGGGLFPIGAVIMKNEVADLIKPGMHGSTFGSNNIAMGVLNKTLDLIDSLGIEENVRKQSTLLDFQLGELKQNHPDIITGITGIGLWRGIAFKQDFSTHKVAETIIEHGVISGESGSKVLRYAPPLNVTSEELAKAASCLDKGFREIGKNPDKHREAEQASTKYQDIAAKRPDLRGRA